MTSLFDQLTQQSPETLEEIIKRCRALLAIQNGVEALTTSATTTDTWLLEGLRLVVEERSLPPLSLDRIRTYREYKKDFMPCSEEISDWLMKQIPADSDRTRKLQLSLLAARCLARHISAFSPISWSTLLHYYAQVPDAIQRQFPAYAGNGWLQFVLDYGRRR